MYLAQITKDRIKTMCKNKSISMEFLLSECELGVNAIRQINDTKGMASFSLARIADYLDCSVDYLLGRTDDPELHTLKVNNKMEIRRETIPYRLAAYGGENEVVENDDESKTT